MANKVKVTSTKNQNLLAALIYLLDILSIVGIIVSIIFLFVEKKNAFIRFHAAQSLVTFGAIFILNVILGYVPGGKLVQVVLGILQLILWILLMIQAYKGVKYKLPYIGDLAEELLKKMG